MTVTAAEAISTHLRDQPPVNGVQCRSSLVALLRDARGVADRDLESGHVMDGHSSQSWLAAAAYLVLLDQIGSCFKGAGTPAPTTGTVAHALLSFSGVGRREALALYALRNALAHDYSLFNPNPNVDELRHAFNYTADLRAPLVVFPARVWSGSYAAAPPPDETTIVNLRRVGDVTEGVVERLRELHASGDLELLMSVDEFVWRYRLCFYVGLLGTSEPVAATGVEQASSPV
jgi:hypothetical protein